MRLLAIFVVAATAEITPAFAFADPAQPESQTTAAPSVAPAPAQTTATPSLAAPAVAPSPAAPAAAAPIAAPTASAADGNLDQIVCKDAPPRAGSRIGGGQECHTQREWNRRQKESQDLTRHSQRTGYKSM